MTAQTIVRHFRRHRAWLALSAVALLAVNSGLAVPAAAQFSIGIGVGTGGIGGGGLMSNPTPQTAAPPPSGSSAKSHKAKSARTNNDTKDKHAKEADTKTGGKSGSNSGSPGVDETSFPAAGSKTN